MRRTTALIVDDVHVALGRIEGDLEVRRGGDLVVRGTVTGSVTVGRGGRLTVLGRIDEDVHVRGGEVYVRGVVLGTIHDRGGSILLDERAYVGAVARAGA